MTSDIHFASGLLVSSFPMPQSSPLTLTTEKAAILEAIPTLPLEVAGILAGYANNIDDLNRIKLKNLSIIKKETSGLQANLAKTIPFVAVIGTVVFFIAFAFLNLPLFIASAICLLIAAVLKTFTSNERQLIEDLAKLHPDKEIKVLWQRIEIGSKIPGTTNYQYLKTLVLIPPEEEGIDFFNFNLSNYQFVPTNTIVSNISYFGQGEVMVAEIEYN